MIKKVVAKKRLGEFSEIRENLEHWLSKTPQERLAAVDLLRRQRYGEIRLQKVVRIIKLKTHKRKIEN
ncbi:MAG: hypothetical protein NTW93_03280 [Phycisphaerae bacterium]|nr:hypothetical protein [Phycisphaerae bacterium]